MKTFSQLSEDLAQKRQELQQRRLDQMQAQKDRVQAQREAQQEKIEKQREREQIKKELKKELQLEQIPSMEPNFYNQLIAKSQLSRKRERESHAQREMEREASAQQKQKRAEMRAIMSRESVESVDENVSSGRAKVRNVKQRVSSAEPITNTERQNKIAQHFSDHAAKKKASGDEAHAAATKAGKSPMEAETARQRAHRQYERQLKKSR
jgi:hypothetical protein